MIYGYTKLATDFTGKKTWKECLIRTLLFFIPNANPDIKKLFPKVKKWLVEIDSDGVPQREIGLDINDKPLFTAPDDRNMGFWTDSPKRFIASELEITTHENFETTWSSVK
jgi:hypothetical protein